MYVITELIKNNYNYPMYNVRNPAKKEHSRVRILYYNSMGTTYY
jgi:hypothetical protein